ncbi:hypothetical protein CLV28_2673 [Sediminihabitans luteus]|uniref:Ribosomally synthesized peptide with SipW-like signal peptide n=1 Tax=Sediminihabitans luteus TaxID=1138585 RepID=A0A2M9CD32_9CELL|nr:hypothetical protein [Sediminihabitans luteus]PJJ69211.1 hypothetical protein CLV28_2673 [Sediminihabitans luteus]GII98886.1 hypothetical protein Slu03_12640 [Sediminihabitans luteus]
MTDRTARRPAFVAALLALLALLGLAVAQPIATTDAAWSDDAVVAGAASAGTWGGGGGEGPITPGDDATIVSNEAWTVSSEQQFCVAFDVTTESTTPVEWSVLLATSLAPFNGAHQGDLTGATLASEPDAEGVARLVGTVGWEGQAWHAVQNNHSIVAGQTASVKVCVYDAGTPEIVQPGDDTYTYTTVLQENGVNNQACAVTTVTGHSQFYVGVEVVVDWSDLLDAALAAGQITPAEYEYLLPLDLTVWDSGGIWDATVDGDTYTARPETGSAGSVMDGKTLTVKGCTG